MNNYAIVDSKSAVLNVVVWDGDASIWQPPAGQQAVQVTEATGAAYIGGTWNGTIFSAPTA